MYYKVFVLFIVCLSTLIFFGCGSDEDIQPGEAVVADKWIDPTDIGKDYTVAQVKDGDTVLLSTGRKYTVGFEVTVDDNPRTDIISDIEDGQLITTVMVKPLLGEENSFLIRDRIIRGVIVPEGEPIIGFWEGADGYATKENHIDEYMDIKPLVKVDRILDYNLVVYLEYQTRTLEGEVKRARYLAVIRKGKRYHEGDPDGTLYGFYVGSNSEHDRASVRILPYAELEEVKLPTKIYSAYYELLDTKNSVIPAGHKFRPYRIRSPSFLMGVLGDSGNW